ncbi:unnamed protein product [Gemmata massiliana]|uniref:Uncharacterized protein n=1 Tax=Gemmata massiliana TaxID=1210884 RepID=A0A6P2DKI7_9BACT|nr:unnamed protein product [Gemmata massiliana]
MRTLLTIGLLTSAPTSARPPTLALGNCPRPTARNGQRAQKAVGRPGWAVEAQGNDIVIRRQKKAAMAHTLPNSINGKPTPTGEDTIQLVLRFAPKISMDEYERLAAINAASNKEYERLHRAVGLPHKFDDFLATPPRGEGTSSSVPGSRGQGAPAPTAGPRHLFAPSPR